MSAPGSTLWFAVHELRLGWRDLLSLMTAGRRRRARTVIVGFAVFAAFMHGLAWLMLRSGTGLTAPPGKPVLVAITVTLLMAWSLMLSQAMESVTRAFYARGDLELILTSPAAASRLFAVRIVAMALTVAVMALTLAAPFINVMVWRDGVRWLSAYPATVALALAAVAVASGLVIGLFRVVGPRRTRLIAQIVAAVIGAAFAIAMQFVAILSFGTTSRTDVLRSDAVARLAPDEASPIWWPARAVLGDPACLAFCMLLGVAALGCAIRAFAPRFGRLSLASGGTANPPPRQSRHPSRFAAASPAHVLRRKEWLLLLRDPWLVSQTLMQLLYLLPAVLLLWRDFQGGGGALSLVVPILIVSAGQLGGGLAWLAVSGEDAPDLIASSPVTARKVLRAKAEAVMAGIILIFGPFLIVLAVAAPLPACVSFAGVIAAAGSATGIQYWFRTQARRTLFRRRQTSSRIATVAEALSSTLWAATGAMAANGTWFALLSAAIVVIVVACAWMISPARSPREPDVMPAE